MSNQHPEDQFQLSHSKNRPVIQLPERLTVLEAVAFRKAFEELMEDERLVSEVIIDFSKTKFIDSSGVGALVANYKSATKSEVKLVLRSVQPPVMAVLSLTDLLQLFQIESDESLGIQAAPETHPSISSLVKRLMDIVGALVGLTLTAVILVPVAIAIKLDSPGPIFFSQTRCGWLGKKFQIWKFRSMCNDAEALKKQVKNQASGAFFKNDADPRITKIGSFLRKTSLDEFPQFWNVLKGDMSLVGTRPPTEEEVESYQVPEWQRLNVKPGMTGEWQVNGRSSVRNFEDVIALDLRYQKNWNLRYDIFLIIKTVTVLFNKNSGAV